MVGFPGGINLGYDSANAQPKLLWRGRFMDAYNTWFVRKFPFEVPMEKRVHHFPLAKDGRYKGFQLEEDGFVTFLAEDYQESFGSKDGQFHPDCQTSQHLGNSPGRRSKRSQAKRRIHGLCLLHEMRAFLRKTIGTVPLVFLFHSLFWESYKVTDLLTASSPNASRDIEWKPVMAFRSKSAEWNGWKVTS